MNRKVELHVGQWRRNRELIQILPAKYPEWIVTAAFYAGVHIVTAVLAKDGKSVSSHTERDAILQQSNSYRELWTHYYQLKDLSLTARYVADQKQWVAYESIDSHVIRRYLYPLEKSAIRALCIDTPPRITLQQKDESDPSD